MSDVARGGECMVELFAEATGENEEIVRKRLRLVEKSEDGFYAGLQLLFLALKV